MLRIFCDEPEMRQRMERQVSSAHAGDCGVDLFVQSLRLPDMPKPPQVKIGSGVRVAAQDEQGRLTGCLLYPRSSLSNTPYMLANSVGVIDAGYRGEVIATLNRIEGSFHTINLNEDNLRLVQICLPSLRPPRVVFVDSLEELGVPPDERGSGGFGSTHSVSASVTTPLSG